MVRFLQKLNTEEKIAAALFLGFALFCASNFFITVIGTRCPLCQKEFSPGESYLWDTRSGDIFPISPYVTPQSDFVWLDGKYDVPQERSVSCRCGYARFPNEVYASPSYCPSHRTLFDKSEYFLILSVDQKVSICYAVSDEGTKTPNGHSIVKRQNDDWKCWELVIGW